MRPERWWPPRRFRPGVLGLGVLGLALLLAVPLVWGVDPLATDVARALAPPSLRAPFGTDALGRDVLARVLAGARLDLGMAAAAVALAAPAGTLIGALAGLRGGAGQRVALRGGDVLTALPLYLMALLLVLVLQTGALVVILATALVNLPFYLRLARSEAALIRNGPQMQAALLAGMGQGAILRRVVAPALAPIIVVQASVNLGWAMLNAAGLSYLGIGVAPPAPEWGVMIAQGTADLGRGAWWVVAFPALALVGAALTLSAMGEALRHRLAPPRIRAAAGDIA